MPEEAGGGGTAARDKALDVLDAVGHAPQGLSQPELAAQLSLPRTTLYRLLGTLVAVAPLLRSPPTAPSGPNRPTALQPARRPANGR